MSKRYILDISREQAQISCCLSEAADTVQSFERVIIDFSLVDRLSGEICSILEKSYHFGLLAAGCGQDLIARSRQLFDLVLPSGIRSRLCVLPASDLVLQITENLVFIPWELLYDGRDHLCFRFDLGRCVKTSAALVPVVRPVEQRPLRMIILADPAGDLPAARMEAVLIRKEMSAVKSINVTTKTGYILRDYVKRNLRHCDILHYAGHMDLDDLEPERSGWKLADGLLCGQDLKGPGADSFLPAFIFMNACQSVFTMSVGGDERTETRLYGLANRFLMSGARHVIGTMPSIPDASSVEIARLFYHHIAEMRSIGGALRQARLDLRTLKGVDDLTWAGYVLYGDPGRAISDQTRLPQQDSEKKEPFLKKWHPGVQKAGLFVFMAGLCGMGVMFFYWQGERNASDNLAQAMKFYSTEDYSRASAVFNAAAGQLPREPARLVKFYELWGSSLAMEGKYDQARLIYVKARDAALRSSDKNTANRLALAQADLELEIVLSGSRFGTRMTLDDPLSRYTQVLEEAVRLNNSYQQAAAATQLGYIHQLRGDWPKAIDAYRSAVNGWDNRISSGNEDHFLQMHAYLLLAGALVDGRLDMEGAEKCLVKFKHVFERVKLNLNTDFEVLVVLQRRMAEFIRVVARKGFKNSDFYRKCIKVSNFLYRHRANN